MVILLSLASLAVDYGRMQLVNTQLQRAADTSARGGLEIYVTNSSYASTYGPAMATNTYNPVDAHSGVAATVAYTWGYWNPVAKTFSTGSSSGALTAVKAVVSRTAANGNAVPLTFPLFGSAGWARTTCDVSATAIAALTPAVSTTVTVSGKSDPWLAGMPNGSTASYDDTAPGESPPFAINVTPGATVSFTNASGSISYGYGSNDPVQGESWIINHNFDSPNGEPAVQNHIGDIIAPMDSLVALFLGASQPNTVPPPTVVRDYTTSASQNLNSYSDIQLRQPFYVGTGSTTGSNGGHNGASGVTSGGVVQRFLVPQGATRLYLGTMDGHEWKNNTGSFTVTVNQQPLIQLVQ